MAAQGSIGQTSETRAVIHQSSHKCLAHPHLPKHHCLWDGRRETLLHQPCCLQGRDSMRLGESQQIKLPQNEPFLHPVSVSVLEILEQSC